MSSTRPSLVPRALVLASWVTLLGLAACSAEEEVPETIERDVFVDTYVDLRVAALQRGLPTVDAPLRDSVLDRAGVTEEQLFTFAEVHGDDLQFMQAVWADVDTRLDSIEFNLIEGTIPPG